MTSYAPRIAIPAPSQPVGPKLSYEIGETCYIHAGLHDKAGNALLSAGKIVFWFDLPDLACRFYVIRIIDRDFMHLMTRDATAMAPDPQTGFPFQRTRHDNLVQRTTATVKMPPEWRNS